MASSTLQPLLFLLLLSSFSLLPLIVASTRPTFHLFTTQSAASANAANNPSSSSSSIPLTTQTHLPESSSNREKSVPKTKPISSNPNPFTAKAAVLRYWDRKIPNVRSHPLFLVSRLSPLSALDSATYTSMVSSAAGAASLTARLPAFCAAARLLCNPTFSQSLSSHHSDSHFNVYDNINFTNYGTGVAAGSDNFKNYSFSDNVPIDTFRSYSRDVAGHDESFAIYSVQGNVVTTNFTSYGTNAAGGTDDFSTYHRFSNVPDLTFTNYDTNANGRQPDFTSYADDTNAGNQSFAGYGKNGNGVATTFTSYANNSNVITSDFANYAEDGNAGTNTFTQYGHNGNVPENNFQSYGSGGNAGTDIFKSYRNQSNDGDNGFRSYGKNENNPTEVFANYGNSTFTGNDKFKSYGEGANDPNITFKSYSSNATDFKNYAKIGVTFKEYQNASVVPHELASSTEQTMSSISADDKMKMAKANKWVVEPGKFFRESQLQEGVIMPMPDIRDKMPERAFLPRGIVAKLPFKADAAAEVFAVRPDTALGRAIGNTVRECERAPSRGETKRCATSAEDMIDFAVEVLGSKAVVRSTESSAGSGGNILIGKVKGINGGKVTESVSCHQSLYPYLVYYCHSVPKVRVYEAEILDVHSKAKINHGVAICHLDTSDWSAGHGAFVALGHKPGEIEVCHWIFNGDMTWAIAD